LRINNESLRLEVQRFLKLSFAKFPHDAFLETQRGNYGVYQLKSTRLTIISAKKTMLQIEYHVPLSVLSVYA